MGKAKTFCGAGNRRKITSLSVDRPTICLKAPAISNILLEIGNISKLKVFIDTREDSRCRPYQMICLKAKFIEKSLAVN